MVHVLNEYPLLSLLRRSDSTGRIAKWGTRLSSFDIWYKPKSSVKGQVLADFVTEFTSQRELEIVCHVEARLWKVFVDSASNVIEAGVEVVLVTPEGIRLEHSFGLRFKASNNETKYEAVLAGLRVALNLGATNLVIYLNSWLVVNQIEGSFVAKDPRMISYLKLVKQTMSRFQKVRLVQIS